MFTSFNNQFSQQQTLNATTNRGGGNGGNSNDGSYIWVV